VSVTVTCVDDPPVAVNDTATVVEDAAAAAIPVLTNDTDIDAGPISIGSVTDPANGTVVITGGGTGLTYQPDANYCNSQSGGTPDTFTYTLAPGGSTATVSVTVTCVNDAPVASDDTFTGANAALANTRLVVGTTSTGPNLTIAGSVLTNDTDPDTPTGLTAGPATISSSSCAGCNNVTMEADGNFTYDPPAGFTGTDTFTYTVNDNDPETPPNQTDTATVTIAVVGPLVWYVDIDAAAPPAGQGGRSHSPFNSLAPLTTGGTADGLDGNGDIIFLGVDTAPATGPYDGGFVLEANQRLWGEPFGLTVDPVGPIPATQLIAATPGTPVANNPNVRNSAVGGIGITLASGVDIQRVNAGVTGTASSTAGISGTAITTATIGPNQLIQGNATGITLSGAAGGNITVAATISGNSATAVNAANRTGGTVTVSGDVTGTAGNAAVILTNNTGATVDFTGAINLAGSGAAISKFSASGGGTITATNAANQITGFTGTGVNLNAVTIGAAGVTFNTVSSAVGGAATGITLTNVGGTGAFTVNGGSITATTRALDIDDNSGNVTIGATLTTSGASARSVEVTNRDGGTVDINALVTDTSQGINLSTNGTGLVRFDGGLNASTGANPAFVSAVSGNLAITDTNGATAPNNTLTTTTGTALSVQNTTIHADDLTFLSITSNGAANGIVGSNTGALGNLVVTGDGDGNPDGGGGTIQNTTGHGISLSSTLSPSLTDLSVVNAGNADNEYGLLLTNVGGTVTLDDMTFNNAADNLVYLTSTSSSTLNVTGSVFSYPSVISGTANSAMLLEPSGAANLTASITGTTFTDIVSASTQIGANTLNASGTLSLTFSNNTINSGPGRAGGVVVSGQELTTTGLTITNNTFTGAGGNGVISIDTNDTSTVTGTISNNIISNPPGIGIFSAVDESATSTLTFNGNTITNSGGDGIQLVNFGGVGTSTMNATVTNNTVNGHSLNTAVSFVGGISVTGFEEVMDLQLTGNAVTGTPASPTQCGGAPCVDYYLEEVGGTFRLEEIPNTAATTANAAYVNSTNDAGPVTIFGVIDLSNGVEISSS
jgi:Bacterial Ig domain